MGYFALYLILASVGNLDASLEFTLNYLYDGRGSKLYGNLGMFLNYITQMSYVVILM